MGDGARANAGAGAGALGNLMYWAAAARPVSVGG